MADFKSLLKKPADSFKKPTSLPAGTYLGVIKGFEFLESKQKHTPYVKFQLAVSSAGQDVDQSLLVNADGTPVDLSKRQLSKDYYLTDDAMWRLTKFLQDLGIDLTGRDLDACIPEARGMNVQIAVTQRPSQDGSELFNDVSAVSPIA